MKILWVENNDRFVAVAIPVFLSEHEVTIQPSLSEARTALDQSAFDVVMVDYDLDDGKGTDLLPALTALEVRPTIIAVSSHEMGNALLRAAGADTICPKARFAALKGILQAMTKTP